jgi:hypothetical protein
LLCPPLIWVLEEEPIIKYTFPLHYHIARQAAFKQITVAHAFEKTGIALFNPDKIIPDMLEPAKNTTTQLAQPVSAMKYPNIL